MPTLYPCSVAFVREVEIRFLRFAGRRVAYAVTGEGPPLVAPAWWVSHLELDWATGVPGVLGGGRRGPHAGALRPARRRHVRSRGAPRGSDARRRRRVAGRGARRARTGKVALFGGSSGGCAAIAFAARFPERVDRLLLYGAYADGSSITSPEVREAIVATVRSHWGLGSRVLADIFLGDADAAEQERLARYQRAAASPETAAALLELTYRNDVRAELAAGAGADAGRAPPRRPRDPVPARPGARGRDPGRDAGPARRAAPISRGPATGRRWRARCVRRWRPRRRAGGPRTSPRRCCSPPASARCWRWSRAG